MSLLTLLQGNNGAGSLIWNLTSWCWPTAPTAPTTLPWSSLARRLSRWLRLAMTWTQFELFALLYKCRCPGGRLPASPRLCSGTHGRGEQSIRGYFQHSVPIISSIFVKLTFTFSASSYWGSRSTSFIWQGCCLNGKNLNNKKQKILYCLITSAYNMFKVTTLFHPSKCTKWKIKSLCFFCGTAEEI